MSCVFEFLAGWRGFTALSLIICTAMLTAAPGVPASNQTNALIPFAELGAKAGAQYQGDGLSVLPAREGARLRCDFQKLEGEATAEGLWLISTADGAKSDRFRVVARSGGREGQTFPPAGEGTKLTSIFDCEFRLLDFESAAAHVGC